MSNDMPVVKNNDQIALDVIEQWMNMTYVNSGQHKAQLQVLIISALKEAEKRQRETLKQKVCSCGLHLTDSDGHPKELEYYNKAIDDVLTILNAGGE